MPGMCKNLTPPSAVARIVAETVQHFITAMDSLKLDMKVVYHIERIPH